jgi:hypothetical protein
MGADGWQESSWSYFVIGILWALPATAWDRPVIFIGIADHCKTLETALPWVMSSACTTSPTSS